MGSIWIWMSDYMAASRPIRSRRWRACLQGLGQPSVNVDSEA